MILLLVPDYFCSYYPSNTHKFFEILMNLSLLKYTYSFKSRMFH